MDVQGQGPTILLLHGWPDTGRLWREVAPLLVAGGYRVAVPDLRGCGRSSKPIATPAYAMQELVFDVAALVEAFRSAGLAQQITSWYTLLFSFEGLAEEWLRKNNHEALRHWLGHPDADAVIAELERDNQLSTHLNWYRANIPPSSFVAEPPVLPAIQAPTLGIWSTGDFALSEGQMTNSAAYCANGFTYERIEGPGHWLPLEEPAEVARRILTFLK